MDRKFFRTGLKPGQNEDFWTCWGWSILVPACPGWDFYAYYRKDIMITPVPTSS
jgi:hypothetical protein